MTLSPQQIHDSSMPPHKITLSSKPQKQQQQQEQRRQQSLDHDDDTPQEWSLLELNGDIQTPKNKEQQGTMELGSIDYDHEGTPTMIIASHELKGQVQALKQPFVVLSRRRSRQPMMNHSLLSENMAIQENPAKRFKINDVAEKFSGMEHDSQYDDQGLPATDDDDDDEFMAMDHSSHHPGYEVAGIVTRKILFDRYPKSIMK